MTISSQVSNNTINGNSTASLGHLFQCLTAIRVLKIKKKGCIDMKFHVFLFLPAASCPVTEHYQEEFGSIVTLKQQFFVCVDKTIDKIPSMLPLLPVEQSQIS